MESSALAGMSPLDERQRLSAGVRLHFQWASKYKLQTEKTITFWPFNNTYSTRHFNAATCEPSLTMTSGCPRDLLHGGRQAQLSPVTTPILLGGEST
jgi:hypothetical protein